MSTPEAPRTTAGSQTDVVIQGIREMILDGELKAGDRLPVEKDLAIRLGVSRGSLREAVRALAILGVVETRQGDGTYVTALDASLLLHPIRFLAELQGPQDAAHLLGVRRVLEPESAARAAVRIDDEQLARLDAVLGEADDALQSDQNLESFIAADTEFHRIIARASGNPALAALIEGLIGHTLRARLWRAVEQNDALSQTQAEHHAILDALRRHDPDRARTRMAVHVLGVEDFAASHAAEQVAGAPAGIAEPAHAAAPGTASAASPTQ
jgi:GntR family transcriptional repressor for pyruvate dehydrogenase complex